MENHDIAKFISETQRGLHRQRQPYEFRVVFTTLSFYVLSTAAALSGKLDTQALQSLSILIWVFFIGVAGMAAIYLYRLHSANRTNICMAENAERVLVIQLEDLPHSSIYVKENDRVNNRKSPIICEFNWLCQSGLILIFALATAFIITSTVTSSHVGDKSHQEPNQGLHSNGESAALLPRR